MRNGQIRHATTPRINGNNGDTQRRYSKSKDKVANMFRSKVAWYTLTAVLVLSIVLLTGTPTLEDPPSDLQSQGETVIIKQPRKIAQISILGERNSGTRWTFAHLVDCFNHTLTVKRSLTRYKHWFQHANASRYRKDTLVVAQFRNPYDWLEAMRKVPHHLPSHMDLEWKEFLTKQWTTPRIGSDLNITDPKTHCQQEFMYKDIVSCDLNPLPKSAYTKKLRFSENQPFYEMRNDGSGLPYDNVMEMRADKIRNFVQDVKLFDGVRDVWVTQYEYLLAKGTKDMLDNIAKATGVNYQCDPFPIQNRRRRPIKKDFMEYLNEHLDWEAEAMAGYYPEQFDKEATIEEESEKEKKETKEQE